MASPGSWKGRARWREAGRQRKREQTTDRAVSEEERGFGNGGQRAREAHGPVNYPILPHKHEVS